ncbi:hypothetical protein OG21DRAFT_639257 [Imleria badia]|nr:hypothetical protein OG21DRAFT_639257 [Imleria badia]
MCYIAICLIGAEGSGDSNSALVSIPGRSNDSSERAFRPSHTSPPLRDYALDEALTHFGHLGLQFESVLQDIKVLERAIELHSVTWNNVRLSAKRVMRSTTPSWPTSRHDLKLNRTGWEVVRCHRALPIEVALRNNHFVLVTLFVVEGSPIPRMSLHIYSLTSHPWRWSCDLLSERYCYKRTISSRQKSSTNLTCDH